MNTLFDITKFDSYKEDNRRKVKRANGGLPNSLWDTYSAFSNCYGGILLLGVKENSDKSWNTTGLKKKDKDKLLKDFWDTINNPKKVSINLLSDDEPVFINNDMFGGTFKRNHEGDYHWHESAGKIHA